MEETNFSTSGSITNSGAVEVNNFVMRISGSKLLNVALLDEYGILYNLKVSNIEIIGKSGTKIGWLEWKKSD